MLDYNKLSLNDCLVIKDSLINKFKNRSLCLWVRIENSLAYVVGNEGV